jgi:ketosteroid isomerase-like protein
VTPTAFEIEILNRSWDAIERDDRDEFRAIAQESTHPRCEWTPLLSGVDGRTYHGPDGLVEFFEEWLESFVPRYEDRQFEELGPGVILAQCRMHLEGRESGVSMDREIAVLMEWEDGLLRRGRAFDTRAAALEAAEELRAA